MKRLRKIALTLDRGEFGNEYGYDFYLKSRCLCNYLERGIRKEKIELFDSIKIVISGEKAANHIFNINSSKIAVLRTPFDQKKFDCLTTKK